MNRAFIRHLILLLWICVSSASAQVSVSPLYTRVELNEVGQAQATFSVSNGSTDPVRFRASFLPFDLTGPSLELGQESSASESDLSPYLRAAPLEFEVPPSGEQVIRVIALVPPSAIETELRAALVIEPLTDVTTPLESVEDEVSGQVLYTYRFIAQIYMNQAGSQSSLDINDVVYDSENGLSVNYFNTGLTSGIGSTSWELMKDDQVLLKSQEPNRFIVLPKGTRTGIISQDLTLEPGEYTLTGIFGTEDGGEPPVVLDPQPFTKTFTVK